MNIIIPIDKLLISEISVSGIEREDIFNTVKSITEEVNEIFRLSKNHDIYFVPEEYETQIKEKVIINIDDNIKELKSNAFNYKEDDKSIIILRRNESSSNNNPSIIYDKELEKVYEYDFHSESPIVIYTKDNVEGIIANNDYNVFNRYDDYNEYTQNRIDIDENNIENLGIKSITFNNKNEVESIFLSNSYLQEISFEKNSISDYYYDKKFYAFIEKNNISSKDLLHVKNVNGIETLNKVRQSTIELLETLNLMTDKIETFNEKITIEEILHKAEEVINRSRKIDVKNFKKSFLKVSNYFLPEEDLSETVKTSLSHLIILEKPLTESVFNILNLEVSKQLENAIIPYDIKKLKDLAPLQTKTKKPR